MVLFQNTQVGYHFEYTPLNLLKQIFSGPCELKPPTTTNSPTSTTKEETTISEEITTGTETETTKEPGIVWF